MEENKKVKSSFFSRINLSPPWKLAVIIMFSVAVGLVLTIFQISNALSYLSDDPVTCVNCHIMSPEYATWFHSSHGRNTVCNDCHVPHDNFFRKYYFKANDGLRHATMFTLKLEPQVIRIKDAGKTVVQENCIRCHENSLDQTSLSKVTAKKASHGEGKLCWDCHREVPHSRVHSLTAAPDARVPIASKPVPEWLEKFIKNENKKTK